MLTVTPVEPVPVRLQLPAATGVTVNVGLVPEIETVPEQPVKVNEPE
jgi:hypothetical protein